MIRKTLDDKYLIELDKAYYGFPKDKGFTTINANTFQRKFNCESSDDEIDISNATEGWKEILSPIIEGK